MHRESTTRLAPFSRHSRFPPLSGESSMWTSAVVCVSVKPHVFSVTQGEETKLTPPGWQPEPLTRYRRAARTTPNNTTVSVNKTNRHLSKRPVYTSPAAHKSMLAVCRKHHFHHFHHHHQTVATINHRFARFAPCCAARFAFAPFSAPACAPPTIPLRPFAASACLPRRRLSILRSNDQ